MVKKLLKNFSRNAKRSTFWSTVVVILALMTVVSLVYRMKSDD